MAGCDRVFLLTSGVPSQRVHGRNAVEAAVAAGVRRVVHLSTADANPASAIPWASAPAFTDALLKASGLDWTLLRPSAFMQNILQSSAPIRRGLLPQTSGRGKVGMIDSYDIAAVAARVLAEPGHEHRDYVLTGPELLSMPDVAATLSTVLHRRVRYLHLPGPLFFLVLRLSGQDRWWARGLVRQFVDVVRHGHDNGDVMTDTVQALTGSRPRSFGEFVTRNREVFVAA